MYRWIIQFYSTSIESILAKRNSVICSQTQGNNPPISDIQDLGFWSQVIIAGPNDKKRKCSVNKNTENLYIIDALA